MRFTIFHSCFVLLLIICSSNILFAQLEVTSGDEAEDLAAELVGSGVTISGVTLDCADGAYGFFDCVDCNVGIDQGILLTSGSIDAAVGPNNTSGAGEDVGFPGDDDLDDIISPTTTNDACILEFDITVTSDTLKFEYVFGSDEYLEYVGSINDVFAFFISGPGIVGEPNIALIPGTSLPVAIFNVNDVDNPEYYVDNGTGFETPYSTDDFYIQYDGFTVPLIAQAVVIPCETYHLKLAIADAADGVLDSGVFIKGGSLTSPGVNITYETEINGYDNMIEGCNDGNLSFVLSFAPTDTVLLDLSIEGTASNGTDYGSIPSSITFLPGETTVVIPIVPNADGIDEGIETIIITLDAGCATGFGDSIILYIYEAIPIEASPLDTIICLGGTATLTASGAEFYSWSPTETLAPTDEAITSAEPLETTTYTVTGTLGTCTNTIEITVSIEEDNANAGNDTTIYFGETAILQGSGGTAYVWSPSLTLENENTANPFANPTQTTTYIVTVTSAIGCISQDTVTVFLTTDALVAVPNAFSPNNDGINDFFLFVLRGQIAQFDLAIYNRWGAEVFRTNNALTPWTGTFNSEPQPLGVYAYILTYTDMNSNNFNLQGNIMLVR